MKLITRPPTDGSHLPKLVATLVKPDQAKLCGILPVIKNPNNNNQDNMKNRVIHIKSTVNGARVFVRNGGKRPRTRQFANLDKAIDFVLPLGSRHTDLYVNGYKTVLYGWVA